MRHSAGGGSRASAIRTVEGLRAVVLGLLVLVPMRRGPRAGCPARAGAMVAFRLLQAPGTTGVTLFMPLIVEGRSGRSDFPGRPALGAALPARLRGRGCPARSGAPGPGAWTIRAIRR